MSRRASAKHHPILWSISLLVIFIAVGGGFYLFQKVNDPFRTVEPLDVTTYLDNANSLRGNVYKMQGSIYSSLAWSPERGRLLAVAVSHSSQEEVLPVLVPPDMSHVNLQKGQRFSFKIEIGQDGLILVRMLSKI